jgi:hypothetical protein
MDVMGIEADHFAWWRIFSPVFAPSDRLSNQQIGN